LQEQPQQATDWYELVKWLTREKPPLGGLLKDAVPVTFSSDKIEVAVPAASQSRSMLIERIGVVKDLIRTHFGKPVDFGILDPDDGKKKP
jgi:hypothetical protein